MDLVSALKDCSLGHCNVERSLVEFPSATGIASASCQGPIDNHYVHRVTLQDRKDQLQE